MSLEIQLKSYQVQLVYHKVTSNLASPKLNLGSLREAFFQRLLWRAVVHQLSSCMKSGGILNVPRQSLAQLSTPSCQFYRVNRFSSTHFSPSAWFLLRRCSWGSKKNKTTRRISEREPGWPLDSGGRSVRRQAKPCHLGGCSRPCGAAILQTTQPSKIKELNMFIHQIFTEHLPCMRHYSHTVGTRWVWCLPSDLIF